MMAPTGLMIWCIYVIGIRDEMCLRAWTFWIVFYKYKSKEWFRGRLWVFRY